MTAQAFCTTAGGPAAVTIGVTYAHDAADALARAAACDAEHCAARAEHAAHLADMTAEGSRAKKVLLGRYAELAACRARRAKQWADAWRLLAEDLAELEAPPPAA